MTETRERARVDSHAAPDSVARVVFDPGQPLNLGDADFIRNKFAVYEQVREHAPVHPIKISIMKGYGVTRHEDCAALLKDPRVCAQSKHCDWRSTSALSYPEVAQTHDREHDSRG